VLEGHFKGIIPQFFKFVRPYRLVADINTPVEAGKIDVDPIGILGYRIEKAAVPDDIGIHGIFKGIRETRLVKDLVFMPGEIDLEITPPFGRVDAVAGEKKKTYYRKPKIGHRSLNFRVAAG
jgi:hypothetical protein